MRPGHLRLALGALVLALVAFVTVHAIAPPAARPASAPETEFSAQRALVHVAAIAKAPHPVGTPAHEEVRAYLLRALGDLALEVRVQETDAVLKAAAVTHAAHLKNVIARLRGSGPAGSPAVMLAAHYDSVPQSRGASDDGSGVATLLETARALKAGPPLKNDVVFLFTDAEEVSACGALAFTDEELAQHPIGVAMNFEARGTRGAVALYDTSASNGALIEAIARVAPRVVSTSVLGSLARILPNDSDATIWKRARIPTYAFAYVDHLYQYHHYTDSVEALDPASLQHDGDYALPLARYFGDAALPLRDDAGVAYFDVLGRFVVAYPAGVARVLAFVTLLVVLALTERARRAGKLEALGVLRGALVGVLALGLATLGGWLAHFVVGHIVDPIVLAAHPDVAAVSGALLGTAAFLVPYARPLSGTQENAVFGGLAVWALALLGTGAVAPAASFVFQWPLLFAAGATALWQRPEGDGRADGVPLFLVPAAFFWSYLAYTVFVMVGGRAPELVALTVALPLLLALPLVARVGRVMTRVVAIGCAAAGLLLAVAGGVSVKASPDLPRPDHLTYVVDPKRHTGRWTTTDETPDAFVAQRVSAARHANAAEPTDIVPFTTTSEAHEEGGLRHASLTVTSLRGARCVRMWEMTQTPVVKARVNDKPVPELVRFSAELDDKIVRFFAPAGHQAGWVMEYCGMGTTPFKVDLFSVGSKALRLRIIETSDGLPGPALTPRGPDTYPDADSDVTEVTSGVTL
jgi:hypothetical protein